MSNKNLPTNLRGKGQASRLVSQHEAAGGVIGIFGEEAQSHDKSIGEVSKIVLQELRRKYPHLNFRERAFLKKSEINKKLNSIDTRLGKVLFVDNSSIRPDGGIIEVRDKKGHWRVVLVGESKHQGNDVEKIKAGTKQGKNKDQDLMVAGNAIERVHKNISEIRNFMLDEKHFPYVVFLQGSNFATKTTFVDAPDGRKVEISHSAGALNRIDRVTASNFGRDINKNLCENIIAGNMNLQSASLYFQCDSWSPDDMFSVMNDIAMTSLNTLSDSLPS